jgi:hypothetical protein
VVAAGKAWIDSEEKARSPEPGAQHGSRHPRGVIAAIMAEVLWACVIANLEGVDGALGGTAAGSVARSPRPTHATQRSQESVNHRIFERKLRFCGHPTGARSLECPSFYTSAFLPSLSPSHLTQLCHLAVSEAAFE